MAWLKIIFNPFYSKIDAFDYDHEAGAISNRRTAVQIDPALGVSLQIMCHALCEKCDLSRENVPYGLPFWNGSRS